MITNTIAVQRVKDLEQQLRELFMIHFGGVVGAKLDDTVVIAENPEDEYYQVLSWSEFTDNMFHVRLWTVSPDRSVMECAIVVNLMVVSLSH